MSSIAGKKKKKRTRRSKSFDSFLLLHGARATLVLREFSRRRGERNDVITLKMMITSDAGTLDEGGRESPREEAWHVQ